MTASRSSNRVAWSAIAAVGAATAIGVWVAAAGAHQGVSPTAASTDGTSLRVGPTIPTVAPTPGDTTVPPSSVHTAPRPAIAWRPIPFGAIRRAETMAYARRHYGLNTWRLTNPRVIVEHYTAGTSFASAYATFAGNTAHLGELPGVCAQFVIDADGTIYQLVPLDTMCRHTVGLNWTAIGIEHVGTSDAQILHDPAQLRSSLRLTLWLMDRFHIGLANVIGHSESLASRYHRELDPAWRCLTHADWSHADMQVYRRDLLTLARSDGLDIGPTPAPPTARIAGC